MKTKADYDGDIKKGKLRSPKIAEFSISIIEGVSERLKVRMMSLPAIVLRLHHSISNMCLTLLLVHMPPEQTAISLQLRTFVIITPPPPFPSYTSLLMLLKWSVPVILS